MKLVHEHRISQGIKSERFRTYAQKHFSDYYPSNKGIKKAIEKGLFHINGKRASTAIFINEGDFIELFHEENKTINHYKLKLDIVFEDEHFAVINKPPGIPVHSYGKQNILAALGSNLQPSIEKDSLENPMPVHRLDSATSGLLIIAKTRSSQVHFTNLFKDKKIKKSYLAVVIGKLEGCGRFSGPVQGKTSLSEYETISTKENDRFGHLSLVRLFPLSGRTHQLRIHCADAGFPILGERKYALDINNLKGKGLFLAAVELAFIHPKNQIEIKIKTDPPKKFSSYFSLDT